MEMYVQVYNNILTPLLLFLFRIQEAIEQLNTLNVYKDLVK